VGRFDKQEKAIGWHLQYNSFIKHQNFVYEKNKLTVYNPDTVRNRLWTEAIELLKK
jgi:hypothetical protein